MSENLNPNQYNEAVKAIYDEALQVDEITKEYWDE